jgi:alkyl sulfatase BDS1-like metallo-beta-lactamase superfamily hydrolase
MSSDLVRSRAGAFDIHPASAEHAIPILPDVWMSPGLSNSFCVATSEGRVVINTGMGFEAGHHRRLYDEVAPIPTRYILLTQGHVDHVGGIDHFREATTVLIAQANNPTCQADDARIHRFRVKRSMPYWAEAVSKADRFIKSQPEGTAIPAQSVARPDVLFDDGYSFELGGVRFELISTPGGETIDSTLIFLPDRGIAFVGNVFSALFGHVPNLVTLRSDRLRFALPFIDAVERAIELDASVLCVGHGPPLVGATLIRGELERVRDGVRWLHDAVVEGMNSGRTVYELMRELRLPAELSLGEGYGKVSWDVRSIWEGYAGWFHARATTELYAVEPTVAASELVALAGGVDAVVRAARRHLEGDSAIEAVALLEHALAASPDDFDALTAFADAHEMLITQHERELEREGEFPNFWLIGWLRHQVNVTRQRIHDIGAT